jgi:hypothetical protein
MADPVVAPESSGRGVLLLAALVAVVGWQLPYGPQVLYPLTLLATYVHEMGHGVTAMLVGARFESLMMHPDGSGLAMWVGSPGRIGRGIVAAGGLVGPSFVGAVVLTTSRWPWAARAMLILGAVVMGASALLFAGNIFAWAFTIAGAVLLTLAARFLPRGAAAFVLQFLGVMLCLSVFRDLDYMFSEGGMVGGQLQRSDSAAIAEALFLPYWFWGAMVAATSFVVLGLGLWAALGRRRPAPIVVP